MTPGAHRMLLWTGVGSWRAEACQVALDGDRLEASGTQFGVSPLPYRLDYSLQTGPRLITQRLGVRVAGEGWARQLDLRHDGRGEWTCSFDQQGEVDLPRGGGELE